MNYVKSNNGDSATKKLVVSAMFCAMAYVAMFVFRFKVSFLTFDFKDVFISILSLLYGPVYGVMSAAVVALLELVTVSDTGWYGLVMNFSSCYRRYLYGYGNDAGKSFYYAFLYGCCAYCGD